MIFAASLVLLLLLKKKLKTFPSKRPGLSKRVYVKYFNMSEIDNAGTVAYQFNCSPNSPGYYNPLYDSVLSVSSAHCASEDADVSSNDLELEGAKNSCQTSNL